jgi:hypothetical protein
MSARLGALANTLCRGNQPRQITILCYNYNMARIVVITLLLAVGCECVSGEEMCSGGYYHMICVDSNWELEENCLDT